MSDALPCVKPADLIDRLYARQSVAHRVLLEHSRRVTRKALGIGRFLVARGEAVDLQFLAEAAMLHDIGIGGTYAPDIGCTGDAPYLQHGIIGARILNDWGLPRHARVCERHTGVGLTADEILRHQLPLPARDMIPETLEEKIICYADLFYSKDPAKLSQEKNSDSIRRQLLKFGQDKVDVFTLWQQTFEPDTLT
mgnify:CR=1 FL=1